MEELETLQRRLRKIGIDVEFAANLPWVYLHKINGQPVKERYSSMHGFTVAILPLRRGNPPHFTGLRTIFEMIRKYSR